MNIKSILLIERKGEDSSTIWTSERHNWNSFLPTWKMFRLPNDAYLWKERGGGEGGGKHTWGYE